MQTAVRLTGTVQPGGRVEVSDPQLPSGRSVEIIVLFPQEADPARPSITAVLADAPGHLAFQTAEDVDAHIREERDTWER